MGITVKSEAYRWWRMGISPIPLMLNSKRPMVRWKPWVDVLPPIPIVNSWFRHHRNLGIVIRNNLCVLDFDNPGNYWFWRKEVKPELSESFTIKSRRGWHVYFWLRKPFHHIAMMEKGGEVRGKGIMVVPPSVHQSGKIYQFWNDSPIATMDSVEDLNVEYRVIEKRTEIIPYSEASFEGDGVIAKIKRGISIMDYIGRFTKVEWNGSEWMCCCPFHDDNNPSMHVHPEEGWCYCYSPSCKAHRRCDVVNLAEFVWGLSPLEAIKILAQEID